MDLRIAEDIFAIKSSPSRAHAPSLNSLTLFLTMPRIRPPVNFNQNHSALLCQRTDFRLPFQNFLPGREGSSPAVLRLTVLASRETASFKELCFVAFLNMRLPRTAVLRFAFGESGCMTKEILNEEL